MRPYFVAGAMQTTDCSCVEHISSLARLIAHSVQHDDEGGVRGG